MKLILCLEKIAINDTSIEGEIYKPLSSLSQIKELKHL
jgi:hypothetical protein